jgi:putative ABC transport system substrate-binding protein
VKRRTVLQWLCATSLAPATALAQQTARVARVGFLVQRARPKSLDADNLGEFPRAMRELGYVEGNNLVIEWRFGENSLDRVKAQAAELVALKLDVIVSQTTATALALQKATASIPIVMATAGDPVASGLVKSLSRPGGNITGNSNLVSGPGAKQLELVIGLVPNLSRVAMLVNPDASNAVASVRSVQEAAQKAGKKVLRIDARDAKEIVAGFALMGRERVEAMIVWADAFYFEQHRLIADLALKHRVACIGPYAELVQAGGLASYGSSRAGSYRRVASYVDRILKGAKPGDLPVEQPSTFELVVNLKTAKALGITIPQSVLLRADEVIQ